MESARGVCRVPLPPPLLLLLSCHFSTTEQGSRRPHHARARQSAKRKVFMRAARQGHAMPGEEMPRRVPSRRVICFLREERRRGVARAPVCWGSGREKASEEVRVVCACFRKAMLDAWELGEAWEEGNMVLLAGEASPSCACSWANGETETWSGVKPPSSQPRPSPKGERECSQCLPAVLGGCGVLPFACHALFWSHNYDAMLPVWGKFR